MVLRMIMELMNIVVLSMHALCFRCRENTKVAHIDVSKIKCLYKVKQ